MDKPGKGAPDHEGEGGKREEGDDEKAWFHDAVSPAVLL